MPHYSRSVTLLGASNSTTTSGVEMIADYRQLSISIESSIASSSRYTIWGTAADGWFAALRPTDFSVITAIVGQGAYTIDPGLRWLKAEREAATASGNSNVTITLNGVVCG